MQSRRNVLGWVWVAGCAASGAAALFLGLYLLIFRAGPPEARVLLEIACLTAFAVGASASGSVLGGAGLLADPGRAEPLRLREASWLLGVPPGLLTGVLSVLFSHPGVGANFVIAVTLPLTVPACFVCLVWAVLARLVARRRGLALTDYACAVFMDPERYEGLKAQKQAARSEA